MLKYWIWLSTREGVSNVQALSLLSRLGSAAAIYQADEDALKDADGRSVPASLLDKSLTGAEIILQQCYQKNIHVMTIQDAQYPARLRVISDPPIVLYYRGVCSRPSTLHPSLPWSAREKPRPTGSCRQSALAIRLQKRRYCRLRRCGRH